MNILIVEDEARIARRIERMTHDYFGENIGELKLIEDLNLASQYMADYPVDLLLLDLNLNGASGFDLLKEVASQSFHIIIISAYKEQAITAFEYGVLDFVPKPFNRERLHKAFERISQSDVQNDHFKFLTVKSRGRNRLIELGRVLYIQGAGIYSELHLKDGTTPLHNKTLDRLIQILPSHFERIHKSYIVPMNEAKELVVKSGGKYHLRISTDELLPISRSRYQVLKEKWFDN